MSGQQDNDDQQKNLQPSFHQMKIYVKNRPRNQQDVATNQAVQTSKPMIRKGPYLIAERFITRRTTSYLVGRGLDYR